MHVCVCIYIGLHKKYTAHTHPHVDGIAGTLGKYDQKRL